MGLVIATLACGNSTRGAGDVGVLGIELEVRWVSEQP